VTVKQILKRETPPLDGIRGPGAHRDWDCGFVLRDWSHKTGVAAGGESTVSGATPGAGEASLGSRPGGEGAAATACPTPASGLELAQGGIDRKLCIEATQAEHAKKFVEKATADLGAFAAASAFVSGGGMARASGSGGGAMTGDRAAKQAGSDSRRRTRGAGKQEPSPHQHVSPNKTEPKKQRMEGTASRKLFRNKPKPGGADGAAQQV
jgi:hypothetical protein